MLTRDELNNVASLFSEGIEPEPALPPAARRARRVETLRESVPSGFRRFALVLYNLLLRRRIASLATLDLVFRDRIISVGALPDPRRALPDAEGLAGLAPDLSPATMIEAYSRGLAPTASLGPVAWRSPPQRFVASPAALAAHPTLRARLDNRGLRVVFDQDVDSVLAASASRSGAASLAPERLVNAFAELFDAGFGHTFEVHDTTGRMVAGGFGIAVGRVFVLERLFARRIEAAEAGLARLAHSLGAWDFALIECGPGAAALHGAGFAALSREDYLAALADYMRADRVGRWPSEGARAVRGARAAA
jgi:leucyl/phenylalanyl-tRNA---protein transferase